MEVYGAAICSSELQEIDGRNMEVSGGDMCSSVWQEIEGEMVLVNREALCSSELQEMDGIGLLQSEGESESSDDLDSEGMGSVDMDGDDVVEGDEIELCGGGIETEDAAMEGESYGYLTPVKGSVGDADQAPIETPTVGMIFSSKVELEEYFMAYANQLGFGIVRASGAKGKGGIQRNTVWTCDSYGQPRKHRSQRSGKKMATDSIMYEEVGGSKRKSKKCGCPVILYAGVKESGEWEIRKCVMEHKGHEFTPGKARKLARNRKNALVKNKHLVRRLFDDRKSRVPVNKIYRCMARSRNGVGEMPFSAKDLHGVVRKHRRLMLAKGDAVAMFEYFAKMTAHNQNFFHMHRLDDKGRLKDVLWVDARSRVAYEEFGDVVCFDSTYMTNEYQLPFSNFVGVNHHGQSILLGCALLSRETVETFEWVFSTWLLCMGGKKPVGILTDQDPAMRRALKNMMVGTCHRWCIWHIMSKFGKKLGKYRDYKEFKEELENAVYDSFTGEEFVETWTSVILRYKLEDDEWLQGLFEERSMWVPAYVKHLFWAGMKTTQRVESMNSFFDGYVDKHTKLYEFVERYIEAMEARADTEKDADDNCARYVRQTISNFPQEKLFQRLYTDTKFKEVQRECSRVCNLNCDKKQVSEHEWEHVVEDRVWIKIKKSRKEIPIRQRRWYTVTYDSVSKEAVCACKLFECEGIICRHMLKVFDLHDQFDVPEKYILRRWRKGIPRKHTRVKVAYHDPSKTEVVCRYDRLMVLVDPICSKASMYKETTSVVIEALQLLDLQVDEKVSMIENKMANAQRESKFGTPSVGVEKQAGLNDTPQSVTQKRKLFIGQSQTGGDDSATCNQTQSGQKSGEGSTPNVLDPVIPPKKAHRTSDSRLHSCIEVSVKQQAAKERKAEAEKKRLERERVKIEKQKAVEQRRLEIEERRLAKQREAQEKRVEKEKAILEKKEARERAAMEKKIERERRREIKDAGGSRATEYNISTGGIHMVDFSGVIGYFTTPPLTLQHPAALPGIGGGAQSSISYPLIAMSSAGTPTEKTLSFDEQTQVALENQDSGVEPLKSQLKFPSVSLHID